VTMIQTLIVVCCLINEAYSYRDSPAIARRWGSSRDRQLLDRVTKLDTVSSIASSRRIFRLHAAGDGDDVISDPLLYKKLLDNEIVLTLTARAVEAFDLAPANKGVLTIGSIVTWERNVDSLVAELSQLSNKQALLAVYANILEQAAPRPLDPLQMSTFQLFANCIMDTLVKLQPPLTPITELVEEMTAVHIDLIDRYPAMIDDGGDEGCVRHCIYRMR
jgi:hypothetical protein